jgi:integrase
MWDHSYAQLIRLHLKPGLGQYRLAKLSPAHVQKFMNDKLAAGLSPRSVQYLRAVLRRALGLALKWRMVQVNAATLVDAPKTNRPEVNPFSPEEARAFLGAIKGDRLEALFTCALALGLRQGEALGLLWDDIDLQARTITVRGNLQRIGHKLQLVEPKTRRSRRTLTLPQTTAAALRTHYRRQLEEKVKAGARWHDTGFVFTSVIGTPLEPRNVVRRFHAVLKEAGLRHQRFHDLRHCAATLLLAQGVELRTIMEILGHSQISITADLYTHVIPAVKREAADLMDGILSAQN